jgi:muconolactone delta-isomerase
MSAVLKFKDGDGGGERPYDHKDTVIYLLEKQNEELRILMRRLLDSDGPEAIDAIRAAEKELAGELTGEREEWFDKWRDNGEPEPLSLERIAEWTDTECDFEDVDNYELRMIIRKRLGYHEEGYGWNWRCSYAPASVDTLPKGQDRNGLDAKQG